MSQKRKLPPSVDHDCSNAIFQSSPIEDRSSTFTAYFSSKLSPQELQQLPEIESASHKMLAWRKQSSQRSLMPGRVQYTADHEDDGEKYGGKAVQKVLESMEVTGACVVARWYGGVMLGPVRFTHMENCAREAVQKWRDAELEDANKKRKTEKEKTERERLLKLLTERDRSVTVLRKLAAEKEEAVKKAITAGVDALEESHERSTQDIQAEGNKSVDTVPQSSPAVKVDYSTMPIERLKALEKARDATLSFLLKRIDKAESSLAALDDNPTSQRPDPHETSDDYAGKRYQWQKASKNGQDYFHRPIGWVENAFDADGRHYEGRADMTTELLAEVKTGLSRADMDERIVLGWAILRNEHALLKASSISWARNGEGADLHFVVGVPRSITQAIQESREHIVFLHNHYDDVDPLDFWTHAQNTARVVDPASCLAKLFVLPYQSHNGHTELRMLLVGAHMIMDGLTSVVWTKNFVELLNLNRVEMQDRLQRSIDLSTVEKRLPLPQEALYPPISGSRARQRWYWLITRILRHVREPLTAGFSNPLARMERQRSIPLPPSYAAVLDYTRTPSVNAFPLFARTSLAGTARLHRLCHEAKASVGAGCFALAALLMMEMYERQFPDIPFAERRPFISGFPLNPRAFFNHHNEPDSLMLAFCDGILLPFLPSSISLDGRIRLLARQAHRQLSAYQKRKRPANEEAAVQFMSSRGAGRVLSNQYISSIERSALLVPPHLRERVHNPQGQYPARPNMTAQTCGVSSIGRKDAIIKRGTYDLRDTSKDFVADYRETKATVRPREGEFLIGIGGDEAGLWVNVTVDVSTLDPALVDVWRKRFETILDEPDGARPKL